LLSTVPLSSATRPPSTLILGSGAWGSALAGLIHRAGYPVQIWSRRGERSLSDAIANLVATAEVPAEGCPPTLISAISMKGVVEIAQSLQALNLPTETILVTATKGLDAASRLTPSQIWRSHFPNNPVVVLSGPNLSKEIEQGLPAATVAASSDAAAAAHIQTIFASDRFRVYTNADPLGTELGGTLKNVIAIAAGVCDGLQLGTNAKSALITRALAEIIRIGSHLGAKPETFFGLSGLGDLLATCSSALSRNYQVGFALAEGRSLEQALQKINGTAEGVNTTAVLVDLAERERIPIPVSRQVYDLLNGSVTPQQALDALMERDLKAESNS
jgi:glycerol-3-phosphate dehydrogenase (NAD(P)+)